jgi:hypothetical protein
MWKGTAPSLKARPATTKTMPKTSTSLLMRPAGDLLEDLGSPASRWRRTSSTGRRAGSRWPARRARSTSSPPRWPPRGRGAARSAHTATGSSVPGRGRRPGSCWPSTSPRCPAATNSDSVKNSPLSMSRAASVGLRVGQRDHHRQRGEEGQQVAHRVGHHHALHAVQREAALKPQVHRGDRPRAWPGQPEGGARFGSVTKRSTSVITQAIASSTISG